MRGHVGGQRGRSGSCSFVNRMKDEEDDLRDVFSLVDVKGHWKIDKRLEQVACLFGICSRRPQWDVRWCF